MYNPHPSLQSVVKARLTHRGWCIWFMAPRNSKSKNGMKKKIFEAKKRMNKKLAKIEPRVKEREAMCNGGWKEYFPSFSSDVRIFLLLSALKSFHFTEGYLRAVGVWMFMYRPNEIMDYGNFLSLPGSSFCFLVCENYKNYNFSFSTNLIFLTFHSGSKKVKSERDFSTRDTVDGVYLDIIKGNFFLIFPSLAVTSLFLLVLLAFNWSENSPAVATATTLFCIFLVLSHFKHERWRKILKI